MEETKVKKAPAKKAAPAEKKPVDNWEYKDRNYYLIGNKTPLTYTITSRHSKRYPLVCVDEQKGDATLKHIVFEKGHLFVPKEKRNLQEFLDKHPHKNLLFQQFDPVVQAVHEFEDLEDEIVALNMAYEMDIEQAEAIMRVELGTKVADLSSKELRRDLLIFAKRNPRLLVDLANDENVVLRNFAIRSVEENIVNLSSDNRSFTWASNGRKLMNVPFDENPYSAMAAWFKTDEGLEVYRSIEKKFK